MEANELKQLTEIIKNKGCNIQCHECCFERNIKMFDNFIFQYCQITGGKIGLASIQKQQVFKHVRERIKELL